MPSINMKVHHLKKSSHKPHTYVKFPHLFVPSGIFKATSKFFWNEVWNREKKRQYVFHCESAGMVYMPQKWHFQGGGEQPGTDTW